jgi:uncharacterized membrane protein
LTYARRVWFASALYAVVYFALGADRYATYHSGADLGLFTQTIASAFHGFSNTVEGGSHFTFHFSPILYLCAPLLWLARSPLALIAIQAVAVALAAPPLFLIARRRVPEPLAVWIAVIALLYPPLAGIAFSDFHENGFAPAATLWLLWAVDARRWAAATLFLAACLAIKEDQAALLAFAAVFGLVYFMRRRERAGIVFCAAAFAACGLVFVSFFAIVRPLAGARHAWTPLHFYEAGPAPPQNGGLGAALFGRFTYLLEAFVPLSFACFASPAILLAVPGFAELFLSRESVTYTMGQHYAAIWIGFVLAAFALGVARIHRRSPRAAANVVRASAVLCALVLVFASPTHWARYVGLRTAHHRVLDRTLASLPPRIDVGTHDELFAHLGLNPNASLGLRYSPDYALFDWTMRTSYWVERTRAALRDPRGGYVLLRAEDDVSLYARRGGGGRR